MKPRTLPLIGATTTILLFSLIWFVPAARSPGYGVQEFGDERAFHWTGQTSRSATVVWEHDLTLPTANTPVVPSVHVLGQSIEEHYGQFSYHITVTANGRVIYEQVTGLAGGGFEERTPFNPVQVKQDQWVKGANHLKVETIVKFIVKNPSDKAFFLQVGPVTTLVYDSDGDRDGVPDSRQLVRGIHSGIVATASAAIILGLGYVMHRARRR